MKFGVLSFSYEKFSVLRDSQVAKGFCSVNLGDCMQSLAVRNLYRELGIPDSEVVPVDRDTLPDYGGPPVVLPMNAVFGPWSFPLPSTIVPIFVGFHAREAVVRANAEMLRRYQPIGCRDHATAEVLSGYGIEASTTGCLTLTLPRRTATPEKPCVLCIYGAGHGAFPAEALRFMPPDLLAAAEFVSQRMIVHRFPLEETDMAAAENYANRLLVDYMARATLVVTSLHHAATPCLAAGISTILCRKADDARFGHLRQITKLYLPPDFPKIDWHPKPADIEGIRSSLVDLFRHALRQACEFQAVPS